MALTKIGKEGITGVSNASDATFLTATSGEGVTLAGTLAVTGVHTIGTNAVATSDGGAVTTSVVQGLAKCWVNFSYASTTAADSFNVSSLTDGAVGDFSIAINNDMVNGNFSAPCHGEAVNDWNGVETTTISGAAGTFRIIHRENNIARDATYVGSAVHGDLA